MKKKRRRELGGRWERSSTRRITHWRDILLTGGRKEGERREKREGEGDSKRGKEIYNQRIRERQGES